MTNLLQDNSIDKNSLRKDWSKGYQSQPNEYNYWIDEDEIEGTIPNALQGTLFRNGVGSLEVNGEKIGHPFDGDGMVCAITFDQGKAHFKNRYVHTEGYLKEQKAGKILYRGFGTQKKGGWLANVFDTEFKNTANTNVIYWGNKLWAMCEGGKPYQLDPKTLDTIGEDNINGLLEENDRFSAHPKIIDNTFTNFGIRGVTTQTLVIFELDNQGRKVKKHSHPLKDFAILHDMLVTPNYYIFIQHPFIVKGLPFLFGFKTIEECLDFNPKQPTKFIIVSRHKKHKTEILKTKAFFGFHHCNAWEKNGKIYIESIRDDDFPKTQPGIFDSEKVKIDDFPNGELWKFELNLFDKTVFAERIEERVCEFPSVHPSWIGKEHRYVYTNTVFTPALNGPLQTIMKIDKHSKTKQLWNGSSREFAGEPVFVPHPNGIEEDDGWLISVVYDAAKHCSYLLILDAKNINKEVAKIYLKHHIPYGFHGNWVSKIFL
ncbi:MAG: carotenoid oxygenase family protein [Xenococcaceae cyanobacterium MO_167.B52]|nr:carotenoid oxygenase family protein [Xenococcaceae cyanobacterium MO_167.B52]